MNGRWSENSGEKTVILTAETTGGPEDLVVLFRQLAEYLRENPNTVFISATNTGEVFQVVVCRPL